LEAKG
jgi:hypothetical protein